MQSLAVLVVWLLCLCVSEHVDLSNRHSRDRYKSRKKKRCVRLAKNHNQTLLSYFFYFFPFSAPMTPGLASITRMQPLGPCVKPQTGKGIGTSVSLGAGHLSCFHAAPQCLACTFSLSSRPLVFHSYLRLNKRIASEQDSNFARLSVPRAWPMPSCQGQPPHTL